MRGTVRQAGHYSLRTPPPSHPTGGHSAEGVFQVRGRAHFSPSQQSPRGALSSSIDVLASRHSASDTAVVPPPSWARTAALWPSLQGRLAAFPASERQRALAAPNRARAWACSWMFCVALKWIHEHRERPTHLSASRLGRRALKKCVRPVLSYPLSGVGEGW